MQFLKILFWCLLAFLAAIFTIGNWTNVQIKLWGGLIAEVNLPLLLLIVFLLGLLPTMLYYQTIRWRLRQRLAAAQNAVDTLRGTSAAAVPTLLPDSEPSIPSVPLPPASVPTAVPPGGA
ncbi:hypothetical protein ASG11_10855 [Sphingomonas sp. Leaf357]|uniref:DUF1049 domain-containing protein n=1 Tax=Sphingomonas sp. Leaf357 TaxID=1736350 RepID=UPI0006F2D19E|nr:DUF1049 domain-containing protein [Sphingomonas sp. Leaf357]KQS04685.1 hypothetical protein ASG11_10855 [Sphingomonas sp. Leaf357]